MLSKIISGVMGWGVWDKQLHTQQMIELLHEFIENGITAFDHADIYGGYTTEKDFGIAFSKSSIDRNSIQLISKCGIQHTQGRTNEVKHYDYSKEYIIWSVENSLKNLQTEYLDVLLLHRPSPLMQADEIAEAVEKLKTEGKIHSFGVSNFSAWQTELIRQKTSVSFNQIQFSATHHQALNDGSLDYMQLHSIQPMSWNPLGSVFKESNEQTIRIKAATTLLLEKYEVSLDILLLAWILKHPAYIIPVVGTTTISRIKSLKEATEINLTDVDWFKIYTASLGHRVP